MKITMGHKCIQSLPIQGLHPHISSQDHPATNFTTMSLLIHNSAKPLVEPRNQGMPYLQQLFLPSKLYNQVHCWKFCQLGGFPWLLSFRHVAREPGMLQLPTLPGTCMLFRTLCKTRPEFPCAQSTDHTKLPRRPQEQTEKEQIMKQELGYGHLGHLLINSFVSPGLALVHYVR